MIESRSKRGGQACGQKVQSFPCNRHKCGTRPPSAVKAQAVIASDKERIVKGKIKMTKLKSKVRAATRRVKALKKKRNSATMALKRHMSQQKKLRHSALGESTPVMTQISQLVKKAATLKGEAKRSVMAKIQKLTSKMLS